MLVCGIDGSLYVGDFNYVWWIFFFGNVISVLELSSNLVYRYYFVMDLVIGDLYVFDINICRIYCLKLFIGVKDLIKNVEVVVGIGE